MVKTSEFVEEQYKPSIGDVITITYDRDAGVNESATGTTKGKVLNVFDSDSTFRGFTMSVLKSDHLPPNADPQPKLKVEANANSELHTYVVYPDETTQLSVVPAVKVEEIHR